MRSGDGEGRSIRSDALYPALSGEWEVPVTRNAKITPGGPPLRDHLWQGPPLPVTLRLIHPPQPKMTQGGNDPLTPLHRLSTASLSGVVRAFAYHRYFRFFLSLFFSTPLNEFFQIQPYAFAKRQRLLSPEQYEIVEVRTSRGVSRVML